MIMWTIALLVVVISLWLVYRKRLFSVLKEQGIPGPEPSLLFGNILELVRKTPIVCHSEWFKKYGKIVGYYFGCTPVLLVCDVDLLKKIQVSDFHNFINRPNLAGGGPQRKSNTPVSRIEGFSQQLIFLRNKRWKEVRSIITPSFTASKMKQIIPIMNGAIDTFLHNISERSLKEESFDIYSMYQGLTLDVIGRTAFGIHANAQNDPNDPFLRSSRLFFEGPDISNLIRILGICFRSLHVLWRYLGKMALLFMYQDLNPVMGLIQSVKAVIASRRANNANRRPDLLQVMIDAEIDDSNITSEDLTATDDTETEKQSTGVSSGKHLRQMTDHDILDNSVLFFLAGFETTSTALAFTTHFLVHYPDVQERIREEVQQLWDSEGELDYNSVSQLQYIEMVLQESMRLYPPVTLFVSRECAEDVTIGNIHFKKGTAVQVPVYHLHRDPDLWGSDVEEFKPERFSPQNKSKIHPMAFQPFGQGPRNCVGKRFAYLEAKLALARLLHKYKLVPCAETEEEKDITLKVTYSSINPKRGIWIKAVPIEN